MPQLPIRNIWVRRVQLGEFYNIERSPNLNGGGGARYIEIPSSLVEDTLRFIGSSRGSDGLPRSKQITVRVIGEPSVTGDLDFTQKAGGRMRIANQNRQATPDKRHPAWTSDRGFPKADDDVASSEEAKTWYPTALHVYLVLTQDGDYYAGFTTGTEYPSDWPDYPPLKALFSNSGVGELIEIGEDVIDQDIGSVLNRIFGAWRRGKGALLYGPPGTGKTYVLSNLRQLLESGAASVALRLDPENKDRPFNIVEGSVPIPLPVATEWITFHQNYSYEDFIIGLRPDPSGGGGFSLKPRLGRLLDQIFSLTSADEETQSVVLFIDEINRGNAARIFGEFITFLDVEYRATLEDGSTNPLALPLPLPSLNQDDATHTEKVQRPSGAEVQLPIPWFFPRNVYLVATMNSVDRGAIPIDSALARRFERVALRPDLEALARRLGIDWSDLLERAEALRDEEAGDAWKSMTAEETAVLLLDRLNAVIATELGEDFELGHSLFWKVGDADEGNRWQTLAACWDDDVFPQLYERYLGRVDQLMSALKVDNPPVDEPYAFSRRVLLGESSPRDERTLRPVRLAEEATPVQQSSLRWLAIE